MDVAVVIPVYERKEPLRAAVESVMDQTEPVKEIIVIDDGSEGTPATEVLEGLTDRRLRLLFQPNLGVSAARNLGIKATKAEWVAFLDSDDRWLPEKNAMHLKFHRDHPEQLISQTDEVWHRDGVRVNPKEYHAKPDGDIFEKSLERCLISPSAVMMKRSLFDDVGLFDPTFPACEDYDLWLRITSRYPVGLISKQLVVKTGGHEDQLSRKHWGMDRFRVRALRKIIDGGTLSDDQKWGALQVLTAKLSILEMGSRKRGKTAEAQLYLQLRERYAELGGENLTLFPDDAL